jgi:hypothetical protein
MINHKAIAVVCVLALTILSPASALAKAGGSDRPLKGVGSGTISFDPATGAVSGEETGVSSQIGQYTVHIEGTGAPSGDGFTSSGVATIVAANGDELSGTYTLTSDGETHVIEFTVTGGTGRFADASGTLTVICTTVASSQVGDLVVFEVECTLEGRISY